MTKFEIGKTYEMRSPCMHDCIWQYTVIARTAQTVTLKETDGEKTIKCRINKTISEYDNREAVHPLGKYSMRPTLRA